MTTFVLIPGAGGQAWYWHLVALRLEAGGHTVVTPDLPAADPNAGLADYATAVERALDAVTVTGDLVVVGQSLAGFVAPLVATDRNAAAIVLVAAMIPRPGEAAGEWWDATGASVAAAEAARREGRDPNVEFDPVEVFFHDVPESVLRSAPEEPVQSDGPFGEPWPLPEWPPIPTRVIVGRFDRMFPLEFMQRVAHDRLGIEPEVIDSGHLPALARPAELTGLLLAD